MDEADAEQQPRLHYTFPTLSPDGSVDHLPHRHRHYHHTPPAALSSQGARSTMADPLAASTASLADSQYDMIDDLSEISNDDQDTASLASTDGVESDGESGSLPHGIVVDEVGELLQSSSHTDTPESSHDDEQTIAQDSFLYDDLETPRQSTMPDFTRPAKPLLPSTSKPSAKTWSVAPTQQAWAVLPTALRLLSMMAVFPLIWALLSGLPFFQLNPVAHTALRREALMSALDHATTCDHTNVSRIVNFEHLLPMPTATSVDFFGQRTYAVQDRARYQTVSGNQVIVSLPRHSGYSRYPSPQTVQVSRGSRTDLLASNTSKLIDGVYAIFLEAAEAYGAIDIHVTTKSPSTNHTFPTYFGRRTLPPTDISKTVNKDLAVARKTATDLAVTLSRAWSRDLQVVADSAVSIYNKAAQTIPSKKTIMASLAASRERALALTEKVRVKGRALKKAEKKVRKGKA